MAEDGVRLAGFDASFRLRCVGVLPRLIAIATHLFLFPEATADALRDFSNAQANPS
ncbi:hypothetical protein AWB83_00758 [Caballeronia ptereochthonis]|uniref:Uncharacterized protein n=1 Tax=Caballeronia ptereochthonis TaxID=1777144 RepID=A0A157ZMK5_9BURK|nr:hypothetical protein AWB83_00758 [Caballeronia ptereochthonis]